MRKPDRLIRTALAFVMVISLAGVTGLLGSLVPGTIQTALADGTVPNPKPLPIEKQPLPFSELAPTPTMAFEELVGDNGVYADETQIPPVPAADTYMLIIDEYHQFGTVYKKDESGAYTVPVRYLVVSSGARKTPSPKGTFDMGDDYVRFGLFVSHGVFGQYWRQITRNIYCHSQIYSARNAQSYTSSYNDLGKRASHGCVRMLVPDARWVYYNLGPGTVCEIVRGDKDDAASAAIKAQLVFPDRPGQRPQLQPGNIPVTEAWPGWQGNAYAQYAALMASLGLLDEASDSEGEA